MVSGGRKRKTCRGRRTARLRPQCDNRQRLGQVGVRVGGARDQPIAIMAPRPRTSPMRSSSTCSRPSRSFVGDRSGARSAGRRS
jgi:hypothetical protein